MSRGKILFALSGSIACYKACDAISKLVQAGFEVETVATHSALEFVGRATLEGLTGRAVHTDVFEPGRYMQHVHLAKWADLTILCPASANTIAKLANGLGDDLVSTLFLAHDFSKPYLVAPAMNVAMFSHPATKENLDRLRSWGVRVLSTGQGRLACGDVGEGRLMEPADIVAAIETSFAKTPSTGKKVLITSGGTIEKIDGVRSIVNTSTGRTGATLAEELLAKGHEVVYLHAESGARPISESPRLRMRSFTDFKSLETAMNEELRKTTFDAVIHAAAVADFSVSEIETEDGTSPAPLKGKIDSKSGLTVKLSRNPKLVESIRNSSANPRVRIAAFKLTNTSERVDRELAVASLATRSSADLVVHNDANEIQGSRHPFTIWSAHPDLKVAAKAEGPRELATRLNDWLQGGLA